MTRALALAAAGAVAVAGCSSPAAPPAPSGPPVTSRIGEPGPPVNWDQRDPQLKIRLDTEAADNQCDALARESTEARRDRALRRYIEWLRHVRGCL